MKTLFRLILVGLSCIVLAKGVLWGLGFFIKPVNPYEKYARMGGPAVQDHDAHGPVSKMKVCNIKQASCTEILFDRNGMELVNNGRTDERSFSVEDRDLVSIRQSGHEYTYENGLLVARSSLNNPNDFSFYDYQNQKLSVIRIYEGTPQQETSRTDQFFTYKNDQLFQMKEQHYVFQHLSSSDSQSGDLLQRRLAARGEQVLVTSAIHTYDLHGFVVRTEHTAGKKTTVTTYRYAWDHQNNWTQKHENGVLVETRQIEYWPQEADGS